MQEVTRRPLYLDHHATTPVDPAVVGAMLPYLTEKFGNPSSRQHLFGQEAHAAVKEAQAVVSAASGQRRRRSGAHSGISHTTSASHKAKRSSARRVGTGA